MTIKQIATRAALLLSIFSLCYGCSSKQSDSPSHTKHAKTSSSTSRSSAKKENSNKEQKKKTPPVASTPAIDTRKLTTDQVGKWAIATYVTNHPAQGFGKSDYLAFSDMRNDRLVYVQVAENHRSPAMKAAGTDPLTTPIVASYRINATGQLEEEVAENWKVVSDQYTE